MPAKARPIQSAELSWLRFSNRRMAMRSPAGVADWRAQLPNTKLAKTKTEDLQYTRLQRQQQLELRQFPQRRKLRILVQLLLLLEALFQRFPQILERQLVAPVFGVHLGHIVMEFD